MDILWIFIVITHQARRSGPKRNGAARRAWRSPLFQEAGSSTRRSQWGRRNMRGGATLFLSPWQKRRRFCRAATASALDRMPAVPRRRERVTVRRSSACQNLSPLHSGPGLEFEQCVCANRIEWPAKASTHVREKASSITAWRLAFLWIPGVEVPSVPF